MQLGLRRASPAHEQPRIVSKLQHAYRNLSITWWSSKRPLAMFIPSIMKASLISWHLIKGEGDLCKSQILCLCVPARTSMNSGQKNQGSLTFQMPMRLANTCLHLSHAGSAALLQPMVGHRVSQPSISKQGLVTGTKQWTIQKAAVSG